MRCSGMLAIVYINVVLYALSFRLSLPLEPFLVQKLARPGTDSGVMYATLASWTSLVYTSGSLAMGLLLDLWGMRCSFIVCYASTALSYGLLSVATTMPLLFLSRVPTFFQHGYLLSQALLLQETSEEERGGALGRIQLAYTAGTVLSPIFGGFLAESGNLYAGPRTAFALTMVSVGLSFLLPKFTAVDRAGEQAAALVDPVLFGAAAADEPVKRTSSPTSGSLGGLPMPSVTPFAFRLLGIPKLRALLSRPVLWVLIVAKIAISVCGSIDGTAEPLLLTYKFGLQPHELGELQGANGFVGGMIAACCLGPLCNKFTPGVLLQRCLVFRIALGMAVMPILSDTIGVPSEKGKGLYLLYVLLMNINGAVLHGVLTVYTTAAVVRDERGTLMGLEHAIMSLPNIVSPIIAGVLLHVGGGALVAGTSALIATGTVLALRRQVIPRYRTKDS